MAKGFNKTAAKAANFDVSAYLEDYVAPEPRKVFPKVVILTQLNRNASLMFPNDMEWAGLALTVSDVSGMPFTCLDPIRSSTIWRMPRGIPWTLFPILSDGVCKLSRKGREELPVLGPSGDGINYIFKNMVDDETALKNAEIIVIDFGKYSWRRRTQGHPRYWQDAWLMVVRKTLEEYGSMEGKRIVIIDDAGTRDLKQSEVDDLGHRASAWARFEYCYTVNFKAIADRILRESLRRAPQVRQGEDAASYMEQVSKGFTGGMLSPLGLQVMYKLREGRTPAKPTGAALSHQTARITDNETANAIGERKAALWLRGVLECHEEPQWEGETPTEHYFWTTGGSMREDLSERDRWMEATYAWKGTGKYPPVHHSLETVASIARGLRRLRLADLELVDGFWAMKLTDAGKVFLDLMHPDCEDPDLVSRWQGVTPEDAAPRLDAWILRFFRKMKTRANLCPLSE